MAKTGSASFGVGIGVACALIILHIGADIATDWNSTLDFLFWVIQIFAYLFVGMIAAKSQYSRQINSDDPCSGMVNAARGAGMIVSALIWIYIFFRGIITGESGLFSGIGVILSMLFLVIDFLLAIGLSSFGGSIVRKQQDFDY